MHSETENFLKERIKARSHVLKVFSQEDVLLDKLFWNPTNYANWTNVTFFFFFKNPVNKQSA